MRSLRTAAVAIVALLGASGCTDIENTLAKVPFLAFMHSSPALDPYEMPRPAPEHSIPSRSPFGVAPHAEGNSQADLMELASRVTNPVEPGDSVALAHGQVMFLRNCTVCHGPQGQGDGTITGGPGRFPPLAPNLTTAAVASRSDGYLYSVVRMGRGLMPAYGPRMTELERWQVVEYVRWLQRSAAGSASASAATAPTTTTAATTTAATTTAATTTAADGSTGGTATPER